jgi:hypothetical protein
MDYESYSPPRSMLAAVWAAAHADDETREAQQAQPTTAAPTPAMPLTPTPAQPAKKPGEGLQGEAKWKAEYGADATLQDEFRSPATYVAFRKAESEGRVRILAPAAARAALTPVSAQAAQAQPAMDLQGEAKWKAEYAADAALQGEFRSEGAYVAFRKAEAAGKVRILRPQVKRATPGAEKPTAQQIIAEWKSNASLRSEFRTFSAFAAYREHHPD